MKIYLLKILFLTILLSKASLIEGATFSPNGISHIMERHWHNAKTAPSTSRFPRDMTVKKLDHIATYTLQKGMRFPTKNGNGNWVYEYTFQATIGITTQGRPARTLRVILNSRG